MSNAPPTRPAISASRDAEVECEKEGKRRKEIKGRVKRNLIMQKVKKKRGKWKKREEKIIHILMKKIKE